MRFHTHIQYDPRHRGLQLILSYARLESSKCRLTDELYGYLYGYCGGWAWADCYFHARVTRGGEFLSYSEGWCMAPWQDVVGVSGRDGDLPSPMAERLIDSVRNYLSRRWLVYREDEPGFYDLKPAAQRRLGCLRRGVSYATPGFDWKLLEYIHNECGFSFSSIRPRKRTKQV